MAYQIEIQRSAAKELAAIPQPHRGRIKDAILALANDLRPDCSLPAHRFARHRRMCARRCRVGAHRLRPAARGCHSMEFLFVRAAPLDQGIVRAGRRAVRRGDRGLVFWLTPASQRGLGRLPIAGRTGCGIRRGMVAKAFYKGDREGISAAAVPHAGGRTLDRSGRQSQCVVGCGPRAAGEMRCPGWSGAGGTIGRCRMARYKWHDNVP